MHDVVHGSGDIGDVLVKDERRVHSGVCNWLVINDNRWRCGGYRLLRRGTSNCIVSVLRR